MKKMHNHLNNVFGTILLSLQLFVHNTTLAFLANFFY
jgi:hypothetical protein